MKLKQIGIIAILFACLIIAGLMYHVYFTDSGSITNSTKLKDTMINIALNNEKYNVSKVSIEQGYVLFYIGNTSKGWNKLLVGVDVTNNNTRYTYLANQYGSNINPQSSDPDKEAKMINIALSSNTVKAMLNNQRFIVQSTDLVQQTVWISIGEPYFLHQINVVIDLDHNTVKSVGDMGCITPPTMINTSV